MDDLDFDDVFQDDEEATAEHEVEDEDVKDSKVNHIPKLLNF
jgi:hypothetical protein